ncbi:carboxypeptidase-like regulatory domain-containing protein [Sanguibacter sp. HDW7]|uniref:carboxypeptidase-like regulatory domain-containing protein n=1 Tax=Sanguibacter sp. HDW7 TaxID=2714931 RepID=UPI00140D6485|nr:carboxypeptidase-like regulatory domain-containing protein [Sanguibacter sp. HDW7]QIK82326.1 carboxypeptidase regulatory-like domain-containing protein [Sanguibacter sp. HDW7]
MVQTIRDFVARSIALLTASALALTLGLVVAPSAVAAVSPGSTLSGRVVNDVGDPVAGAIITVLRVDGSSGADAPQVVADGSGRFRTRALVPGKEYFFRVEGPTDGTHLDRLVGRPWPNDETPFVPGDAETPVGDITLTRASSVTGTLVDSAGDPLVGAVVIGYVYDERYEYWGGASYTTTDDAGRYEVTHLPVGKNVRIGYTHKDYQQTFHGGTDDVESAIDVPMTADPVDLGTTTPLPAARISGRVVDESGNPVDAGDVRTSRWNGETWVFTSYTDLDGTGTFTIGTLTPGSRYRLEISGAWNAGLLPTHLGGTDDDPLDDAIVATAPSTELGDIVLRRAATISGRVTTDGTTGIEGGRVDAYIRGDDGHLSWKQSTTNGADGLFTIGNLTPGASYILQFTPGDETYAPVYFRNATDGDSAEPVVATADGTQIGTVTLKRAPRPTPTVTPTPTATPKPTPPTTPPGPTAVTLTRPAWSRTTQTYGSTKVGSVTTTVTGLTSGTVTFKRGGTVLGKASIKNGRATLKMSRRAKVGSYAVTAHVNATSTTTAATSAKSRTFKVVKAKLKATAKISGKSFTKNTRPKVTVTLGRLNTGGYATGKVKVYVGKKVVTTVTLKSKHKGKITVTLPKKYATSIKLKAVYMGSSTVASSTSKTVTVKTRR